jgi:hypothetical protein
MLAQGWILHTLLHHEGSAKLKIKPPLLRTAVAANLASLEDETNTLNTALEVTAVEGVSYNSSKSINYLARILKLALNQPIKISL